jgi:hypothetical protein
MYDACDYLRPPFDAAMVAGYVSGGCQWPAAAFNYWRHAKVVTIATGANVNAGMVLDVERGDATPDQAPGWCARARLRGQDPTVYTSTSNVAAVLDACTFHAVPPPHLWVANWSDGPVIPADAIACQYDNDNARGYDISVVADYWPGVDPAPPPPPTPTEDDGMYLYQDAEGTIWAVSGGTRLAFTNSADVQVYLSQGVKLYLAKDFSAAWQAAIDKYPAL